MCRRDSTYRDELRGVWVATVYNIDFTKAGGTEAEMKAELSSILDTAKAAGLNAVLDVYKRQVWRENTGAGGSDSCPDGSG